MKKILLSLTLLFAATALWAQSAARKFSWANSADGQSVVYAYLPDASKTTGRAVVDCPGGGYEHLAMDHEGHDWAAYFNDQGIAYFVLKYRMPDGDRSIPMGDAYHAIKTVRDSAAQWHVNPYDVGIMGFSAGGHLASTVSTHAEWSVRPNFSILFYPVISMNAAETHKGSVTHFLGNDVGNKSIVDEYTNYKRIQRHLTPPTVILLANDDGTVPPVTNGVAYYSAMRRAGNDCALYIYPTGGHGFGFRTSFTYHNQMLDDLTTWLATHPSPKEDAVRVACIGNSITDGYGIDMADEKGYPAQLQKKLGAGFHVINFGVSGRTLLNKGDHPYQKEEAWHDALAFHPNIVVIKLGTNDSKPWNWSHKADFRADFQQMIDSLKAQPSHPRIYLATPIPGQNAAWGITDSVISREIIPLIQKVAKKNKLAVIDLHSLFKNEDNRQVQGDDVHPTEKGAGQMAALIYNAITMKDESACRKMCGKK